MKTVTLKQVGYLVGGESVINLWGGGSGSIQMDSTFIPLGKMNKSNLLGCINDGGFGCESIDSADIYVYDKYEGGHKIFNRIIYVDHKNHLKQALRGIK